MYVQRTVMKLGRVVFVHSEQTQSRLRQRFDAKKLSLSKLRTQTQPGGGVRGEPNMS